MFVYPWIDGDLNWSHVQNVWDRWQGLNVGMLAFISSIAAFNISRYNANKQREREFLAAKAFLPQALSDLSHYLDSCASLLHEAWNATEDNRLETEAPELPESYKPVFSNCIKHAESDIGSYLTNVLVRLQVNNSRLSSLRAERTDLNKPYLISCLYRLGELQVLINKLFDFARNKEEFDSSPLVWEDFRNVYSIWFTFYDVFSVNDDYDLESFTKRRINNN
jgi:hypothetical protein